ncbi:hypothetical protein Hanom_Chr03g00186201 [Helianthus anomalus]
MTKRGTSVTSNYATIREQPESIQRDVHWPQGVASSFVMIPMTPPAEGVLLDNFNEMILALTSYPYQPYPLVDPTERYQQYGEGFEGFVAYANRNRDSYEIPFYTSVETCRYFHIRFESPRNQEEGAFVSDDMESSSIINTNTTITGGNSDYPIKLGDELRYKDLTNKMSSVETSVAEMKDMMKQMMEILKSQPSTQQIVDELW